MRGSLPRTNATHCSVFRWSCCWIGTSRVGHYPVRRYSCFGWDLVAGFSEVGGPVLSMQPAPARDGLSEQCYQFVLQDQACIVCIPLQGDCAASGLQSLRCLVGSLRSLSFACTTTDFRTNASSTHHHHHHHCLSL